MYLIDTNVLSELRRPRPHGAVLAWFSTVSDADIHISAVTIGEIQVGIERTRDLSPSKAAEIEAWLDRLTRTWPILPMDERAFRRWAVLMHRRSTDLSDDAMIAATAETNGLKVVSRNTRHFAMLGLQTLNPFPD